jgi:hypothetical protein
MNATQEADVRATVRMCDHARAFSTRPRGAELADAVRRAAQAADHVDIDFTGVLAVSYSFIDQFTRDLDGESSTSWTICFVGMAPSVERVVRRNCSHRGVDAQQCCVGSI